MQTGSYFMNAVDILRANLTSCDGGSCRHPCSHAATMRGEWHSFLLMIRPGAEYQFIYLKYSLGSNNYKPSHLFIRPHYSLSSTPTWILGSLSGLGYTAHYWIWGQPNQSLVITFLTIAKNCKNSAAPGQVYCSVVAGDTKSWNNKMISNKKLRVVCIFAGAQIWQV